MAFQLSSSGDHNEDLNDLNEINVTPFIDVMLVLLIIFMITAPLSTSDVPVDLPSTTRVSESAEPEPLVVTLKDGGNIYVQDAQVTQNTFPAMLDKISHNRKDTRVFLRADKSVNYAALMALMDLLRDSGYIKIALVGLESSSGKSSK